MAAEIGGSRGDYQASLKPLFTSPQTRIQRREGMKGRYLALRVDLGGLL
jgi:hypothetical protein